MITPPTGLPPTPTETLVEVCDIVSESPSGSIERAALHGTFRLALAFTDPTERLQAVAELGEVTHGRGLPRERFHPIAASGLEIAAHRRRARP